MQQLFTCGAEPSRMGYATVVPLTSSGIPSLSGSRFFFAPFIWTIDSFGNIFHTKTMAQVLTWEAAETTDIPEVR